MFSIWLLIQQQIINILSEQRKQCQRALYSCKEHILGNRAVTEDSKQRNINLSKLWIDYRKAQDRPHFIPYFSMLLKILRHHFTFMDIGNAAHKQNGLIQQGNKYINHAMSKWKLSKAKTNLIIERKMIKYGHIPIITKMFHVNPLPQILYCLALGFTKAYIRYV